MSKRPIDRTKKSNIKCEHCKYAECPEPWSNTWYCVLLQKDVKYWNRCKQFEWAEIEQEPCGDAVSRQAVVKFLGNHSKDFEDARIKIAFMAASSLVENTEYIPPVTPTQRWIPVSERLPEEHGGYLVTVKYGWVTRALWVGNVENWKEVIAWMPLPEPYETHESEDKE